MALTRCEQEAVINFNAGEDTATLYTADPVWIRKMDKLVVSNPEQFSVIKSENQGVQLISKTYKFPKRFVSIRSKDVKLNLSDEKRQELSERAKRLKGVS